VPHDDAEANACGFPSAGPHQAALSAAIAALPEDIEVELVSRIAGEGIRTAVALAPEQKTCPQCGHIFQRGWFGIDAHWRARHEHRMPYAQAWPLIKAGTYRRMDSSPEEVAADVSDKVLAALKGPNTEHISPELDQNQIILCASPSGWTLTITCDGANAFRLRDDDGHSRGGFQTQVTVQPPKFDHERVMTETEMLASVERWARTVRPAA
jgi:hypothetical protein